MPDSHQGKPDTPGPWKEIHFLHSLYQRVLHFCHQSLIIRRLGSVDGGERVHPPVTSIVVGSRNSCTMYSV
jgi:hypothetical protein